MPGFDIRTIPKLPLFSINSSYYLYDTFSTDRAAGAVNGTLAEPVGGARTVTDTNSKITITGGVLSFATGAAVGDKISYTSQSRVLGKSVILNVTPSNTSLQTRIGWNLFENEFFLSTAGVITNAGFVQIGTYTATQHTFIPIMRAAGMFYFVRGGNYTNFTLLDTSLSGTSAQVPSINIRGTTTIFTADNIRVPKQTYIPVPLQSDGFSASTTDGLGNPENNGIAGNAYTNVGTWGVTGGKRSCSVLSGGVGLSVLSTSTRNVFVEVDITMPAGNAGIVVRYSDSNNYIQCIHSGSNVLVYQIVGGTPTLLSSTPVAFSTGATMKFTADELTYRAFYNNTAAGSGVLPDTSGTKHGLMTNNIGNTFDNLVVWAKGNEGQYSAFNNL